MKYILLFLFGLSTAYASTEIMNLNEFMPTRMEDASVSKRRQVELQASLAYEDEEKKFLFRPNVRWGAIKRVQLEYSSDHLSAPKGNEQGSGASHLGAQWNFNDQTNWAPSLAIESQLILPSGKHSHGTDSSFKALLTYTLVGTLTDPLGQFHLNYRWYNNSDQQQQEKKSGELFLFGYSHKISPHSSVLVDFLNEENVFASEVDNIVEVGWIQECWKNMNIGIGAGLDIKNGYYRSIISTEFHF